MATDARAVSRDLFSATIGSIACCYVGQPLDTIKVRMQTSPDQFSGVYSSTTNILKNEVRTPRLCWALRCPSFITLLTLVNSRVLLPFGRVLFQRQVEWCWRIAWPLESTKP
jgi:hypothetical protein